MFQFSIKEVSQGNLNLQPELQFCAILSFCPAAQHRPTSAQKKNSPAKLLQLRQEPQRVKSSTS